MFLFIIVLYTLAEQFLESARFIIHFPKYFGMLSNWYFIDVQWLGNILLEEQDFKVINLNLHKMTSLTVDLQKLIIPGTQ